MRTTTSILSPCGRMCPCHRVRILFIIAEHDRAVKDKIAPPVQPRSSTQRYWTRPRNFRDDVPVFRLYSPNLLGCSVYWSARVTEESKGAHHGSHWRAGGAWNESSPMFRHRLGGL